MTAGLALAPAAGAQTLSDGASLASLSVTSDVAQTKMTPAFHPEVTDYFVAAPSEGDMVTVNVEPAPGATLQWTGRDADPNLPGHQMAVTAGDTTSVSVGARAEDGVTYRWYGISVARASNKEKGWRVYDDVLVHYIVDDPGHPSHYLMGLWADDSRVLTIAWRLNRLYAFNTADSSRRPYDEFVLSGNTNMGVWSDGTTLWAMDYNSELRAYNLSDGSLIPGQTVDVSPNGYGDNPEVDAPRGIWSDGDTIWVVDRDNAKVLAFALPTDCPSNDNYCPQSGKDFDLLDGNDDPWGITADADTWWVSDLYDRKIYAYNRSDGSRDSDKDFDLLQLGILNQQQFYHGLAATDTIMYVAEYITNRIYSFSMPGVSGPIGPALQPTKSPDATLSALSLSGVSPVDLDFMSDDIDYDVGVANGVTSTTVDATPNDAGAAVVVNLDGVMDADGMVDLDVGENEITVVVTAADGRTTMIYTVTVTRAQAPPLNDATLIALSLSGVSPVDLDFMSDDIDYDVGVANAVTSTTVDATPNDAGATVVVNLDGVEDADGMVDLAVGDNEITVVVTAADTQTTKTYTVTVKRAASAPPKTPDTSNPGTSNPGVGPSGGGSFSPVIESDSSEDESDTETVTPLADVGDAGTDHQADINELHGLGVFAGTLCQANRLCPNDPLARWIAAVWLVRLIDGDDPDPVTESRFADVSASTMWEESMWFAPHVERLADLEITVGCGQDPLNFCTDVNLTKSQAASWLARAFDLESDESAGFGDAAGSVHEANINAVVAAGVMEGCSTDPKNFCVNDTVTKGEMASYVNKARKAASN